VTTDYSSPLPPTIRRPAAYHEVRADFLDVHRRDTRTHGNDVRNVADGGHGVKRRPARRGQMLRTILARKNNETPTGGDRGRGRGGNKNAFRVPRCDVGERSRSRARRAAASIFKRHASVGGGHSPPAVQPDLEIRHVRVRRYDMCYLNTCVGTRWVSPDDQMVVESRELSFYVRTSITGRTTRELRCPSSVIHNENRYRLERDDYEFRTIG